jgi:hypothetical protein
MLLKQHTQVFEHFAEPSAGLREVGEGNYFWIHPHRASFWGTVAGIGLKEIGDLADLFFEGGEVVAVDGCHDGEAFADGFGLEVGFGEVADQFFLIVLDEIHLWLELI